MCLIRRIMNKRLFGGLIWCVRLTKPNDAPAHCYWNRSGQIHSFARPRWAEGLQCPSGQEMERERRRDKGGGGGRLASNPPPTNPSLPRQIISLRCWNMLMLIWCWEINDGNTEQLPFFPMLPFQQRRRRGTGALQQYSKWLLLIWRDGQGNQPTCSGSPALLTATWSPQELYFIMSYANASGWKAEKGKESTREGGEEVWGGEQIDYRLEQMAQQVREERNFSFFHWEPHSVHFLAVWPLCLWEGADPGTLMDSVSL